MPLTTPSPSRSRSPTKSSPEEDRYSATSLTCDESLDEGSSCGDDDVSSGVFAEDQARLALEELDLDMMYRCMLRQELQRPDFSKKYEYLKYRRVLVDWMAEVGEEMQIRKTTIHTAIAYLERILATGKMPSKDRFQLLALTCISLAAKYEGPEEEIPPMAEFWEFGNRAYTYEDFHQMELKVLADLQWSLTALTPIHFMRFYLSQQVLFADDRIQGREMVDEALDYFHKYADFFVDLCYQEYQFQAYRPSLVAAAILAASRKALGMTPVWREELSQLTGYSAKQIEPCFSAIWTHYVHTFGDKGDEEEISPSGVAEFPEESC